MEYKYAIVIGRFQPFHYAHAKILEKALTLADKVIVIIGSHRSTQTIKNPFTSEERKLMIAASLGADLGRLHFGFVRDYLYNDNLWLGDVQAEVGKATDYYEGKIALVGSYSDDTSYYLSSFPRWKSETFPQLGSIHATDIRRMLYQGYLKEIEKSVPGAVFAFMCNFVNTAEYTNLVEEFNFIEKYKEDWKIAPYPPTFVTCDAVVVQSGHILVVKRRSMPGRGLYALPGGFVTQRETIHNATVREIKEETGVRLKQEHYKFTQVFDHPDRSLRGRTITHASRFDLGVGPLVAIKGGDDAESAHWMSLNDVYLNEDRFFEDHIHIIQELINK